MRPAIAEIKALRRVGFLKQLKPQLAATLECNPFHYSGNRKEGGRGGGGLLVLTIYEKNDNKVIQNNYLRSFLCL